jgi:hypothetical protein
MESKNNGRENKSEMHCLREIFAKFMLANYVCLTFVTDLSGIKVMLRTSGPVREGLSSRPPDYHLWGSSVPTDKFLNLISISSKSFPIHHLSIILPFDAMFTQLLTTS